MLLQIFNIMRAERPELLEKVHPIRADYSAIDLDIDAADRAMLSSEVQVSIAIAIPIAGWRALLSVSVGNSINRLLCENFCECVRVCVCEREFVCLPICLDICPAVQLSV